LDLLLQLKTTSFEMAFSAVGRGIEPHARKSINWISISIPDRREIPTTYHDYYYSTKKITTPKF